MTKHTNSGIYAGDWVIVHLENFANGRRNQHSYRRVQVERVTPTQVIIEGIRYHADRSNPHCGDPVNQAEKFKDHDDYKLAGYRKFAHPQTVDPLTWDVREAELERPESLARARAISHAGYDMFGYPYIMRMEQILKLSTDPALMVALDKTIRETERIRRQALESGRAFFATALGIEVDQ